MRSCRGMLVTNTDTPGQPQGSNPYSPQPRQPWYKRWWAILLFVLAAGAAIFGIVMLASGSDDPEDVATSAEVVETPQPTRGGDDPIDDSSARGDEPAEITEELRRDHERCRVLSGIIRLLKE